MRSATERDIARVDITEKDIAKALARPSDFGYFGDDKDTMFHTWSLGSVIEHRDSGLLDKSNARALVKHLEGQPELADDWKITSCNHWAVGWVNHLSFRAVEADGVTPTRMFRVLTVWFNALSDYPVADESLYSEMECEASDKWIGEEGPRVARNHDYILPEDWQYKVNVWWDANDQGALESRDDQGACPSEEQFLEAFAGCEFAKEAEGVA